MKNCDTQGLETAQFSHAAGAVRFVRDLGGFRRSRGRGQLSYPSMQWLIALMGSGILFFGGAVLLAAAVVVRAASTRHWARLTTTSIATVGIAAIAASAIPLPPWLYVMWALAAAAWIFISIGLSRSRRTCILIEAILLATIVTAISLELPFELKPSIPAHGLARLYVIGDSITAGIGRENGYTWPRILRDQHQIQVIDLSHPGVGAGEELHKIHGVPLEDGLVLLEIGGNDLLGHTVPRQFGRDLESLVRHVSGPGKVVVMLELPLFPFDNAYGVEQRSVARRFHVVLIPRRCFADVLSGPSATVDGIHLSPSGQRRMAEMIWNTIGDSLQADTSRTPLAPNQPLCRHST